MLLRTEVLGPRAWLAKIGVPDADPTCQCGAARQTLKHVLTYCPLLSEQRIELLLQTGTTRMDEILQDKTKIKHAAKWPLDTQLLEHFTIATQVANERTDAWKAFRPLQEVR